MNASQVAKLDSAIDSILLENSAFKREDLFVELLANTRLSKLVNTLPEEEDDE